MNKITSSATTLVLIIMGLSGCSGSNNNQAVNSCVNRGISYFKEIGSYPTLWSKPNAGRSADMVARERCNRTTSAF